MAVDLWPYSGRQDGRVSDTEHEALWSVLADGILPGQAGDALAVSVDAGQWIAQPGRVLVAGHVLSLDEPATGELPAGVEAGTRVSVIAAYLDRGSDPWGYGVRIVHGTPGEGRPNLPQSRTGLYVVALRAVETAPDGAQSLLADERPRLYRAGLAIPAVQVANNETVNTDSSPAWEDGDPICETSFVAPPSGRVMIRCYARARGSGDVAGIVGYALRRGDRSGPVIREPEIDDSVFVQGDNEISGEASRLLTGLAPGDTYWARVMIRSNRPGTFIRVRHRRLLIEPQPA